MITIQIALYMMVLPWRNAQSIYLDESSHIVIVKPCDGSSTLEKEMITVDLQGAVANIKSVSSKTGISQSGQVYQLPDNCSWSRASSSIKILCFESGDMLVNSPKKTLSFRITADLVCIDEQSKSIFLLDRLAAGCKPQRIDVQSGKISSLQPIKTANGKTVRCLAYSNAICIAGKNEVIFIGKEVASTKERDQGDYAAGHRQLISSTESLYLTDMSCSVARPVLTLENLHSGEFFPNYDQILSVDSRSRMLYVLWHDALGNAALLRVPIDAASRPKTGLKGKAYMPNFGKQNTGTNGSE